jgi:hypothetical protein
MAVLFFCIADITTMIHLLRVYPEPAEGHTSASGNSYER